MIFLKQHMYILQAAFGRLLFNEVLNRTWWIGSFLVICGTIMIGSEKQETETPSLGSKKDN